MSVPDWRQPQGLRGRPGFKPTCRAEFAAWTASGRAGLGAGGRRQDLAELRDDAPSERSATKHRRYGGRRRACGACLGAGGRRQGLAGLRDDAPSERSATKRRRCGGRRGACGAGLGAGGRRQGQGGPSGRAKLRPLWKPPQGLRGLASVPVGGGRAWPGFEIDHSEPQARVWRSRGRAAAHRHAQRPNPTRQATRRPENPWCHKPRPKVRTPRSTPGSGRPGGRRGDRAR